MHMQCLCSPHMLHLGAAFAKCTNAATNDQSLMTSDIQEHHLLDDILFCLQCSAVEGCRLSSCLKQLQTSEVLARVIVLRS